MDVGSKATGRSRATTTGEGSDELRQAEKQLATRHVSGGKCSFSGSGRGRFINAVVTPVSFKKDASFEFKVLCILRNRVVLQKKK